jgi:hypothetical protein
MAPVYSDTQVYLRNDRSITQFMLENVCNTDPKKVICEDTLSEKKVTYGGIREDAFRVANSLRTSFQLGPDDTVSIISRSCVRTIPVQPLALPSEHPNAGRGDHTTSSCICTTSADIDRWTTS